MARNIKTLLDLTGKTALVTGGSRGLGLQMAEALGEAGARILVTARKKDELTAAVAHLKGLGIDADWVAADCADPASIEMLCDTAMKHLGHIDILVNNA
ncbi:MAG: SDR family NAD(P)-dependent oxidoreductase, partial [Burkholderiaceae bacterium]